MLTYITNECMPLEKMLARVQKQHPGDSYLLVEKAYKFAEQAHAGQVRKSGEPYFIHPVSVASILTDLMSVRSDLQSALWQDQDSRQLADLFERCLAATGKTVEAMSKDDRLKMIALLEQHNAFSFRKSVPYVAKHLGVSRYTIYKYLGEVSEQNSEN